MSDDSTPTCPKCGRRAKSSSVGAVFCIMHGWIAKIEGDNDE